MPTKGKIAPSLLIISGAPAGILNIGLLLDKKFVEGMRLYAENWAGRVGCLLPESLADQPFGEVLDPSLLPFKVNLHPKGHYITAAELQGYDIVLCSGDNDQYLHIAEVCRNQEKSLFFIIENIPETRRQIVMLDRNKSILKKLKSILYIHRQEIRRRKAFSLANGLQANGYPAAQHYHTLNPNTLLYLDNRINANLLATEAEMAARRNYLTSGGRLRLIHSGRLEPLKGSQDLIQIACHLRDQKLDFILDIFGTGSLESDIREGISRYRLQDHVRMQGVADFATELVPYARQNGDIFISCHRQSDPSCSYLENMGCGLAVMGYSNKMWNALMQESGAGWATPLGNWKALAEKLLEISVNRTDLAITSGKAWNFTKKHLLENTFKNRIAHLIG